MLWMGSGWWSVAGLISDVIGFSMLALDLLPEYRINRLAEQLSRAAELTARKERKQFEALAFIEAGTDSDEQNQLREEMSRLRQRIAKAERAIDAADLLLIAAAARRYFGNVVAADAGALSDRSTSNAQKAEAVDRLFERLDQVRSTQYRKRRPPIYLAITLIVVGFLLQAWGSIPA